MAGRVTVVTLMLSSVQLSYKSNVHTCGLTAIGNVRNGLILETVEVNGESAGCACITCRDECV